MTSRQSLSMHSLQRADKRLGLVLCVLLQPLRWLRTLLRHLPARAPSRRVLSIKFWGIGSLQLLTPSVRALRLRHPDCELVLLTLAANRPGVEALGVFDRVLTLDVSGAGWLRVFQRIAILIASLRRERFDEVYDFEFFTRFSTLIALATGARTTHGFSAQRVWRGSFHTREVLFNRYWHVARNFRLLSGGEDGQPVQAADLTPLDFAPADEERLDRLLSDHGVALDRPLAVVNVNAGTLSLERRWPAPSFAELAVRLVREEGLVVALIGTTSERAYTGEVAALVPDDARARVLNLAGELELPELAALLARASVVVSNDSGPMHLAAALGAPTVGLFGPETPVMYAPIGQRVRALYRPTPCSPCINVHDNKFSSCIFGHPHCLVNITPSEVFDVARSLARGEDLVLVPQPRRLEDAVPAPLPKRVRRL